MEKVATTGEHPPDNVIDFEVARRVPRLQSLSDSQMDALLRLIQAAPALLKLAEQAGDIERLVATVEKITQRCPVAAHIVAND